MTITAQTRRESHGAIHEGLRCAQIEAALRGLGTATAKEIAVRLYDLQQIPSTERNFTAPRLTELVKKGAIEVAGKKRCAYTGKAMALYRLTREVMPYAQQNT